jgi:proteic killer suppression protein
VIGSFRSRTLARFWNDGDGSKISPELQDRLRRRLEVIHLATDFRDFELPGFRFHRLHGKPVRYSVHVNGPWCVTFEWDGKNALLLDFEQYH